jgi:hypothetical protein
MSNEIIKVFQTINLSLLFMNFQLTYLSSIIINIYFHSCIATHHILFLYELPNLPYSLKHPYIFISIISIQ